MKNRSSLPLRKVEQDPFLFMGFLTLVVGVMYVVTLITVPALHQPVTLIVFTVLINVHIVLHWYLYRITEHSMRWVAVYIIGQGILALAISLIANTVGMVFALYMGLIGESVGLLGLTRRGLLAIGYNLFLSMVCFAQLIGLNSLGWWALGTIPIVIFIVIYVTLYTRQAEARAQAQSLLVDLEKANQELSEYADRVEDLTIANERQRMARELHDTLSQGLAGLILQLEAADAYLAQNNDEKARQIVQQSMHEARTTLDSSRRAIDNLRQPSAETVEEAIRYEAAKFSDVTGIPCDPKLELSGSFPEDIREAVVRSVAEGLNNIAHHADAHRAEIVAVIENNTMKVTLKDDGRGFDQERIPSGHYGIIGMRERIRSIGGQLEITSSPQQGTSICMTIPIPSQEI